MPDHIREFRADLRAAAMKLSLQAGAVVAITGDVLFSVAIVKYLGVSVAAVLGFQLLLLVALALVTWVVFGAYDAIAEKRDNAEIESQRLRDELAAAQEGSGSIGILVSGSNNVIQGVTFVEQAAPPLPSKPVAAADGVFRAVTVHLWELVDESGVIEGRSFEDCEIEGPAVIVPLGKSQFVSSTWIGPMEAVLWEFEASRERVIGAIGLRDCTFMRCTFRRIGIAGPPEVIAKLRAAIPEV